MLLLFHGCHNVGATTSIIIYDVSARTRRRCIARVNNIVLLIDRSPRRSSTINGRRNRCRTDGIRVADVSSGFKKLYYFYYPRRRNTRKRPFREHVTPTTSTWFIIILCITSRCYYFVSLFFFFFLPRTNVVYAQNDRVRERVVF